MPRSRRAPSASRRTMRPHAQSPSTPPFPRTYTGVSNWVFEALGDPARRLILELLAAGEQPAGAVVTALQARAPISQPAVSQHLKVLRGAGLVTVRAEGTRRLYALDPDGLGAARTWLEQLTDPL